MSTTRRLFLRWRPSLAVGRSHPERRDNRPLSLFARRDVIPPPPSGFET